MPCHPRASVLFGVLRIVNRTSDKFGFVVEPTRDFVQSVSFGWTFTEVRPRTELLPWWPTVTAAGKFAPAVERHRLRFQAKFEAVDFSGIIRGLGLGNSRPSDSEH